MFIISVFDKEDRCLSTIELEKKYDFVSGVINLYNREDWVKCYTIVDKDTGLQIADFEKYCESHGLKTKDKNASSVSTLQERHFDQNGYEHTNTANTELDQFIVYEDENGLKVTSPASGKGLAHDYIVEKADKSGLATIQFQNGPIPEVGVNGLTNEALLKILIHRTRELNKLYPCRENQEALFRMQQAFQWFNQRTINRKARGVEGTYQK